MRPKARAHRLILADQEYMVLPYRLYTFARNSKEDISTLFIGENIDSGFDSLIESTPNILITPEFLGFKDLSRVDGMLGLPEGIIASHMYYLLKENNILRGTIDKTITPCRNHIGFDMDIVENHSIRVSNCINVTNWVIRQQKLWKLNES